MRVADGVTSRRSSDGAVIGYSGFENENLFAYSKQIIGTGANSYSRKSITLVEAFLFENKSDG